jgi:hypothetical protein
MVRKINQKQCKDDGEHTESVGGRPKNPTTHFVALFRRRQDGVAIGVCDAATPLQFRTRPNSNETRCGAALG